MANRGMSAAMIAESAKQDLRIFHLLEMYFSTTHRLTTAYRPIVFGANTYQPLGHFISFGDVSENMGLESGSMRIALSGVDQTKIQEALTEDFIERRVVILRGFVSSAYVTIVDPVVIFDGRIDNFSIDEDTQTGSSVVTWNAASHWVDFERTAGRRTNSEDQNIYFPGDKGFEFSSQAEEIKWGKA